MEPHAYSPHSESPLSLAFKLSLPVFLSYFPLGIVFGALFAKLHVYWYMAPIMSAIVYSGTVQFVTLGLLKEHASYFFIFVSTIFIAGRNAFYGLSFLERYRKPTLKKIVSIFLLVDTNYALMLKTPPFHNKKQDHAFCLWLGFLLYLYWLSGTLVGSLFGRYLPGVDNLEFVLVAFFAIMLVEQYRQNKLLAPIVVGLVSFTAALFLAGTSTLLLMGILLSCVLLIVVYIIRSRLI